MMMRCAVLGSPIQHSLSPTIHNRAYQILGIEAQYTRFEVNEFQLEGFLAEHIPQEWRGFSLTMPLKEIAVGLAAEISDEVRISGALNTLVASNNEWHGFNTDVIAIHNLLRNLEFRNVAILGGGGTAKAALAALRDSNVSIQIFRRSSGRDLALRTIRSDIEFMDWDKAVASLAADLLINTVPATALGFLPNGVNSPAVILDAIYQPWPPPFAELAKIARYISGKELLVEQGIEQLRLFTGIHFDNSMLRPELLGVIS